MKLDRYKVKLAMARCGYDWADVAKKMGCTKQNLQVIMSRGKCNTKTLGKLARALDCDPLDLVTLDE